MAKRRSGASSLKLFVDVKKHYFGNSSFESLSSCVKR